MRSRSDNLDVHPEPARSLGIGVLRLGWAAVRLPMLALLVVFQPVVELVLAATALLIALAAVFLALVRPVSTVPVGGMLAIAAGAVLLLALYYALLRLLAE